MLRFSLPINLIGGVWSHFLWKITRLITISSPFLFSASSTLLFLVNSAPVRHISNYIGFSGLRRGWPFCEISHRFQMLKTSIQRKPAWKMQKQGETIANRNCTLLLRSPQLRLRFHATSPPKHFVRRPCHWISCLLLPAYCRLNLCQRTYSCQCFKRFALEPCRVFLRCCIPAPIPTPPVAGSIWLASWLLCLAVSTMKFVELRPLWQPWLH